VPLDEFLAAITRASPGLIRTDADEVTYDFHVMMRAEIEAGLLDGSRAARQLPGVWREHTRANLGLEVPNDREGCLQDAHWAAGLLLHLHDRQHHGGTAVRGGLRGLTPGPQWTRGGAMSSRSHPG